MLSLLLFPSHAEEDLFGEGDLEREQVDGEREDEPLEVLEVDLGDFEQCLFEQ